MKNNPKETKPGKPLLHTDVAVIGAGASGLLCAIEAGRRGRSVLVLDHNAGIGKKILASGGGRCNFTNLEVSPGAYFSSNPDFCRSALSRYGPEDFIGLMDKHSVPYHEKESGQMFVSGSSALVVRMLEHECAANGVVLMTGSSITGISRADRFQIETDRGTIASGSLVVAAGGLARPDMGATDLGIRTALEFGLSMVPTEPALTGFLWSEKDRTRFGSLAGISLDARVTCGSAEFDGSLLFTHHGLSGPVAMNATLAWKGRLAISVDFAPGAQIIPLTSRDDPPEAARRRAGELLRHFLPERLARRLAELCAPQAPLARWSPRERAAFEESIHSWPIVPANTEGFEKAEVMRGGVDTRELSSRTLESRKVPGLYFTGEVVDVTGKVGGFNLHWAWASGWAAGQSV